MMSTMLVPTLAKSAGVWIADNILVVEAFFTVGRTVVFGSDIQDICVLGWASRRAPPSTQQSIPHGYITKPAGRCALHLAERMGNFVSCEELALAQRDVLGLVIPTGQDPLT